MRRQTCQTCQKGMLQSRTCPNLHTFMDVHSFQGTLKIWVFLPVSLLKRHKSKSKCLPLKPTAWKTHPRDSRSGACVLLEQLLHLLMAIIPGVVALAAPAKAIPGSNKCILAISHFAHPVTPVSEEFKKMQQKTTRRRAKGADTQH